MKFGSNHATDIGIKEWQQTVDIVATYFVNNIYQSLAITYASYIGRKNLIELQIQSSQVAFG